MSHSALRLLAGTQRVWDAVEPITDLWTTGILQSLLLIYEWFHSFFCFFYLSPRYQERFQVILCPLSLPFIRISFTFEQPIAHLHLLKKYPIYHASLSNHPLLPKDSPLTPNKSPLILIPGDESPSTSVCLSPFLKAKGWEDRRV